MARCTLCRTTVSLHVEDCPQCGTPFPHRAAILSRLLPAFLFGCALLVAYVDVTLR